MNNLKVGSLIKLVSWIAYVPVVNFTIKRFERLPIGGVGMILKINNTGKDPPRRQDIVFLYEDQIYETYHMFIEPL